MNYIVPFSGYWKGLATFVTGGGVGVYDGEWQDGLPHGHGIFENNIYKYKGEFRKGDPHGLSEENTMWWKSGLRAGWTYKGAFANGKMSGQGVLKNLPKFEYIGSFWSDSFHGEGKLLRDNGRIYDGSFAQGYFTSGKYVDHTNRTFIGHFKNKRLNGRGLIQFQDGWSTEGTFKNNKLIAEKYEDVVPATGKFDGRDVPLETKFGWYVGKWKDRKPHDKHGRIYGFLGERFEGEFRKGKKTRGVEYYVDGRVFTGTFSKHGPLKGKTVYYGQNNNHKPEVDEEGKSYFEGEYNEKGLPTGNGTEYNSNTKMKYEGFFLNGKFYNNGKVTFGNGFAWVGKFSKDGLPILPYYADVIPPKGVFGPITVRISASSTLSSNSSASAPDTDPNIEQFVQEILENILIECFPQTEKDSKSSDQIDQPTVQPADGPLDACFEDPPDDYRLYHGYWKNRQYDGKGILINFSTGRYIEGIWENGKLIRKQKAFKRNNAKA